MKLLKFAVVIAIFTVAVMAFPGVAAAQDDADNLPRSATGCLLKRPGNVYLLTDEDGKTWDLRSTNIKLDKHVGHTVRVTGTVAKEHTNGPDTSPQNHLLVTKVEMLRNDCNQQ
ncbi:MAG: DUF5818 domain-containing protein [Candidatus Acidiferrales bacterium]